MSDVALLQKSESTFVPASLNVSGDSQPIRGEILGLEHLEEHARRLAESLGPVKVEPGTSLLQAFHRNAKALPRARAAVAEAVQQQEPMGSDADWLLDNYHIVSETLAEIQVDLPGGYYSSLPKLQVGPLKGLPRPYAIALELTAHSDSGLHVDVGATPMTTATCMLTWG